MKIIWEQLNQNMTLIWYFVTKSVLTQCEKKLFLLSRNYWDLETCRKSQKKCQLGCGYFFLGYELTGFFRILQILGSKTNNFKQAGIQSTVNILFLLFWVEFNLPILNLSDNSSLVNCVLFLQFKCFKNKRIWKYNYVPNKF